MRKLTMVWCVLGSASAQAACPLPEVELPSVAAGDNSFDAERTRAVLQLVVAGADADARRARFARLSMGAELARLGRSDDPAPVSYDARALATRLRQLHCAVWSNNVAAPDALYRAISDEAMAALRQLGGSPLPPATVDDNWTLAPPFASSQQRANDARLLRRRIGGGVLMGLGTVLAAGGVALAVDAALRPQCTSCFLGPINTMEQGVALALGMGSIASGVCGGLLAFRRPKGMIAASASPLPGGGLTSVRMQF
jgi:hypothetical protein